MRNETINLARRILRRFDRWISLGIAALSGGRERFPGNIQ